MIEQHNSLSEKFIKKGFWLYLFILLMAPLGYITKILLTRNISSEELGVLYLIISFITLISALNDLGVSQSMNYFIPRFVSEKRYDKVKSLILFGIGIQLFSSLIIVSLFFISASFLSEHFFHTQAAEEVLKIFAFFFLGINIFQTINTFFMAIQDTFLNKITEFIRMLSILFFIMGAIFLGKSNVIIFSYAWLLGLCIGLIIAVSLFLKKFYFPYLQKEKCIYELSFYKEIFQYSFFLFLGAQAAVILSQMDMLMIGYFLSPKDAAYYTNYLSIISIPFLLFSPLLQFLLPVFSELHSQKKSEKIAEIKNIFSEILLSSSLFMSAFFCIFATHISILLFGKEYITSGYILYYSIPFLFFLLLLQLNFSVLGSIGKVKERFYISFWALGVNFIGNIILINKIGVYGAALATAFGWIFIFIFSEIKLDKIFRTKIKFYELTMNLLFLLSVSLISIIFLSYFENNYETGFLIKILPFFIVIWSIFYIIPNKNKFLFLKKEIQRLRSHK